MTQTAQNMLERLVKALVEHPDEVSITPIEGDGTVVFEVQVNPEDAGKIIGVILTSSGCSTRAFTSRSSMF